MEITLSLASNLTSKDFRFATAEKGVFSFDAFSFDEIYPGSGLMKYRFTWSPHQYTAEMELLILVPPSIPRIGIHRIRPKWSLSASKRLTLL